MASISHYYKLAHLIFSKKKKANTSRQYLHVYTTKYKFNISNYSHNLIYYT